MKGKDILQKWQIDFEDFFDVYSSFLIDGYIDDVQPFVSNLEDDIVEGSVEEVELCEYFERLFCNQEYHGSRNLLVIYDPTEAVGKRFDIKSRFVPTMSEENDSAVTEGGYIAGEFPDSRLANHLYEVIRSESIQNQLIDHSYNGASPDFAKIHYVISEEDRLEGYERVFKDFLDNIASMVYSDSSQETNYVFVIKMLSRLKTAEDGKNLSNDELEIFRQLLSITNVISKTQHKIIILADKNSDLPTWFSDEMQNYNVKNLSITRPSDEYKEYFFDRLIDAGKFGETFQEQYQTQCIVLDTDDEETATTKKDSKKRLLKKFLAYSNDFSMRQLSYYDSYLNDESHEVSDLDKVGFSLANFRFGELKNPWEDDDKIKDILNINEKLKRKLKGQDFALDTIQQILKRSTIGLDRIDNPDAPRVILFLAGPTGTGKTEVCKQIAEIIFGSADRIVRFDMSEYGADESDQKLFGAPPGYVGYEAGGKLTNAIMKEPFSLVLFDEIEKANPSILDKFLQILSDGRLTSGKGETVSFTDSIIVITSNAGVTSSTIEGLTPEVEREKMGLERPTRLISMETVVEMEQSGMTEEEIYAEVSNYLRYFVKFYFVCNLNRPELYGRIEDSIVYYNYIGREAVALICKAKIKSFIKAASDKYQVRFDMSILENDNPVLNAIVEQCQKNNVRSMGARGIGKEVNKIFNGSLSDYISTYIIEGRKNELVGRTISCSISDEFINSQDEKKNLVQRHIIWN